MGISWFQQRPVSSRKLTDLSFFSTVADRTGIASYRDYI